jgi:hypothetical protein
MERGEERIYPQYLINLNHTELALHGFRELYLLFRIARSGPGLVQQIRKSGCGLSRQHMVVRRIC